MADKMEFPKTIEAFIGNYSFRDSDEVYTNGAELIPVFRVAQALEHYLPEVKANTIEEFSEQFCAACCENTFHATINGIKNVEMMTLDGVTETIFEVAEKMKGGD